MKKSRFGAKRSTSDRAHLENCFYTEPNYNTVPELERLADSPKSRVRSLPPNMRDAGHLYLYERGYLHELDLMTPPSEESRQRRAFWKKNDPNFPNR